LIGDLSVAFRIGSGIEPEPVAIAVAALIAAVRIKWRRFGSIVILLNGVIDSKASIAEGWGGRHGCQVVVPMDKRNVKMNHPG
jgi:hypothetical protein